MQLQEWLRLGLSWGGVGRSRKRGYTLREASAEQPPVRARTPYAPGAHTFGLREVEPLALVFRFHELLLHRDHRAFGVAIEAQGVLAGRHEGQVNASLLPKVHTAVSCGVSECVRACVRVCVCVCARACMYVCVCARALACVCVSGIPTGSDGGRGRGSGSGRGNGSGSVSRVGVGGWGVRRGGGGVGPSPGEAEV